MENDQRNQKEALSMEITVSRKGVAQITFDATHTINYYLLYLLKDERIEYDGSTYGPAEYTKLAMEAIAKDVIPL
jgi:hypothetical protein